MRASGFGELCVVLALLPGCLWAKEVRCPCIADTLMGGHRSEVTHNFGGSDYLRLKGRQGVGFFRFDMTPARGMKAVGARLCLHSKGRAFVTDKISTIAQDWIEGQARFMRSLEHFYASLNYIHHNPVKHGHVQKWQDWPFSSVHWYLEKKGRPWLLEIWKEYPLRDYGKGWDW